MSIRYKNFVSTLEPVTVWAAQWCCRYQCPLWGLRWDSGILGERGLVLVVHFPLGYVANTNIPWPWPWLRENAAQPSSPGALGLEKNQWIFYVARAAPWRSSLSDGSLQEGLTESRAPGSRTTTNVLFKILPHHGNNWSTIFKVFAIAQTALSWILVVTVMKTFVISVDLQLGSLGCNWDSSCDVTNSHWLSDSMTHTHWVQDKAYSQNNPCIRSVVCLAIHSRSMRINSSRLWPWPLPWPWPCLALPALSRH